MCVVVAGQVAKFFGIFLIEIAQVEVFGV